jgi:dolichol-phosphate mannosyltransferase
MLLSVVVPCFDEEHVVALTHERLSRCLRSAVGEDYEIVYVDDGSVDRTRELLEGLQTDDPRVRLVIFARNFGHQIAVTAGIEHAQGDAVVLIDADLQDPPEVIPAMLAKWREGYEVVFGVRTDRDGESRFKLLSARLFYRALRFLSDTPIALDSGDFRLMSRCVVDALRAMPERDRFIRGMVAWVGFRQIALPYHREARAAGTTKYGVTKMARLALDAVTSFSNAPLRLAAFCGFTCAGVAVALSLWAVGVRLYTDEWVAGWAAIFIAVLYVGGVQMLLLGIVGEYVGRIFMQAKRRPLYIVAQRRGFGVVMPPSARDPGAVSCRTSGARRDEPATFVESIAALPPGAARSSAAALPSAPARR